MSEINLSFLIKLIKLRVIMILFRKLYNKACFKYKKRKMKMNN